MAEVGYIRVSSFNQNDARQLAKVKIDHIFKEKISVKNLKRPKLQECLDFCKAGDTLHVNSMDRLARNLKELQQIIKDDLNSKNKHIFYNAQEYDEFDSEIIDKLYALQDKINWELIHNETLTLNPIHMMRVDDCDNYSRFV